jgi:hypothetical protein
LNPHRAHDDRPCELAINWTSKDAAEMDKWSVDTRLWNYWPALSKALATAFIDLELSTLDDQNANL